MTLWEVQKVLFTEVMVVSLVLEAGEVGADGVEVQLLGVVNGEAGDGLPVRAGEAVGHRDARHAPWGFCALSPATAPEKRASGERDWRSPDAREGTRKGSTGHGHLGMAPVWKSPAPSTKGAKTQPSIHVSPLV